MRTSVITPVRSCMLLHIWKFQGCYISDFFFCCFYALIALAKRTLIMWWDFFTVSELLLPYC